MIYFPIFAQMSSAAFRTASALQRSKSVDGDEDSENKIKKMNKCSDSASRTIKAGRGSWKNNAKRSQIQQIQQYQDFVRRVNNAA